MSKTITKNKFDNKALGINREINEEIGQLKNNRIHYTSNQSQKNNKSREKLNQRVEIKFEDRNKHSILCTKKSNTKITYTSNKDNRSISKDKVSKQSRSKSREKGKIIKTKVIKKRNIGQIERVVIDLINEDIDSIKTDQSNTYSLYESEKHYRNNKELSESIPFKNKDNNGTNSTNSINEKLMAINKIEGRWANNSISNKEVDIYYIISDIERQKNQIKNMINIWKNKNEIKKQTNLNFIGKKNDDIKTEEKKKENNLIKKEIDFIIENNKIINKIEKMKDLNNFKYFEEKYLNDIISKVPFPETNKNNNNIFYILNISNISYQPIKFNYKLINPKDKTELQSSVINYYNENKLNNSKLNKSNNSSSTNDILEINPLIILNEDQMSQLYDKLNKSKKSEIGSIAGTDSKKENPETTFTISKQIAIDYEIIEKYQSNITKTDKNSEPVKLFQNFGQSTPLSMLYEKFLVFGVSRNIKYSVQSPQSNIFYENPIKKASISGFDKAKLNINKFSLWVEKIDKIESCISTDKKTS
jgi:hypothetical protein